MNIAIYSRKSVETDTGESIKNQIKLCKEYFQRQEDCKFEIFEDEGFSGGNINRPSFKRMMELAKMKQFDIIAVYKIDRIARNIVDFVNIYDELDKLNIKLVSITEGFDPSTPAGKMMMLLLASFAEMERMNIAQRVKDNMKELAKMGRWSGGTAPRGYTTKKINENGKIVTYLDLIKEDAPYIVKMFKQYSSGLTTYQISKNFKNEGLNFSSKSILNILNNPTYLISTSKSIEYLETQGYAVYGNANGKGFLPYNRRLKIKGKKTWNNRNKFVGVSTHEAIIDIDLWIKVQQKLNEKTVDPHPHVSNVSFLSGGFIKCKCGSGMVLLHGNPTKNVTQKKYFSCARKRNGFNCPSKNLRVDYVEEDILDYLKKFLNKDYLKNYLKQFTNNKNNDNEIKSISKKIALNNAGINNLVDKLMLLSNNAATALTKKIEELSLSNQQLNEKLLLLKREKMINEFDYNNAEILYNNIDKIFKTDDIELRRTYIKNVIEKIVYDYDTDTFEITLVKRL